MDVEALTPKVNDPLWSRYVLRPVAFPIVKFLHQFSIKPNSVSLIGTALALLATSMFFVGGYLSCVVAAIIFNIVALLDCVDGTLARYSGVNDPMGSWFDAQTGYTVYAFLPLALSWKVSFSLGENYFFSPEFILLAGALNSILNLYSRILFQKFSNVRNLSISDISSEIEKRSVKLLIVNEIGLVGMMMPILLICSIYEKEIIFISGYFIVYSLIGVFGSIDITLKSIKLSKNKKD